MRPPSALEKAGVPKYTKEGKLDVHACRTAYANMILRSGADVKTLQTLTRQTDLNVALNNYGRDSEKHLEDAAASVAAAIFVDGKRPISGQYGNPQNIKNIASLDLTSGCDGMILVGETEFEPAA